MSKLNPILLLVLAFVSLFFSPLLVRIISGSELNGVITKNPITIPTSTLLDVNAPSLIIASYAGCSDVCPSNYQTIKSINEGYNHPLNLLLADISNKREANYITWLSEYTGMPAQRLEHINLAQENISSTSGDAVSHNGNLYVYYPQKKQLLSYPNPTAEKIIGDLNTLNETML